MTGESEDAPRRGRGNPQSDEQPPARVRGTPERHRASEGREGNVTLRISDEQLRRIVAPAFEEYRDAIVRATCDALAERVAGHINRYGTARMLEILDVIREFPEAGR